MTDLLSIAKVTLLNATKSRHLTARTAHISKAEAYLIERGNYEYYCKGCFNQLVCLYQLHVFHPSITLLYFQLVT